MNYLIIGLAFLLGSLSAAIVPLNFSASKSEDNTKHLNSERFENQYNNKANVLKEKKSNNTPLFSQKATLKETHNNANSDQSIIEKNSSEENRTASRKNISNSIALSKIMHNIVDTLGKEQVGGWGIDDTNGERILWISVKPDSEMSDKVAKLLQQTPSIEIRYDSLYSLNFLEEKNLELHNTLNAVMTDHAIQKTDHDNPLYSMIDMNNNQLLVVIEKNHKQNVLISDLVKEHIMNTSNDIPIKVVSK